MKEKITALLSFIGGIGWSSFGLYIIAIEKIKDGDDFFAMFALLTTAISTVLYVVWTKFGKMKFSELEKIDYQNQLLKKQIEQKELKRKLENSDF